MDGYIASIRLREEPNVGVCSRLCEGDDNYYYLCT